MATSPNTAYTLRACDIGLESYSVLLGSEACTIGRIVTRCSATLLNQGWAERSVSNANCHCDPDLSGEAISESNSEIASLPLRYAQGFGSPQ